MTEKVATAFTGQVGEQVVHLQLALRCVGTDWRSYRSVNSDGHDITLINQVTGERRHIEVKTRSRIGSVQPVGGQVNFSAGQFEYDNLDVMVCYFADTNDFLIVPKADLRRGSLGKGKGYDWSYFMKTDKAGRPRDCEEYVDAWHNVHPDLERTER